MVGVHLLQWMHSDSRDSPELSLAAADQAEPGSQRRRQRRGEVAADGYPDPAIDSEELRCRNRREDGK
jgi:hypothetical protein